MRLTKAYTKDTWNYQAIIFTQLAKWLPQFTRATGRESERTKVHWIVNNTGHHGAHQWHWVEYERNVIRFFDLYLK